MGRNYWVENRGIKFGLKIVLATRRLTLKVEDDWFNVHLYMKLALETN